MNTYEIENKLRDKADKWELHNLKSEVERLQNENRNLDDKVARLENRISNHYSAIEQLVQIIIDSALFGEREENLMNIRQCL